MDYSLLLGIEKVKDPNVKPKLGPASFESPDGHFIYHFSIIDYL